MLIPNQSNIFLRDAPSFRASNICEAAKQYSGKNIAVKTAGTYLSCILAFMGLSKLVWNAFGAEFYGFELDVVGVAFEGDLADEGGEQFFVLAFVGPVG